MKISLITHNVVRGGGQGRVNYELVSHFLAKGVRVEIIAHTVARDLVEAGAIWRRIAPAIRKPDLLYVRAFAKAVDKAMPLIARKVDVVIANGFVLRHPHTINICHFVHGAWSRSEAHVSRLQRGPYAWYQNAHTRFNATWEKQAFASAKVIVAVSAKVRDELIGIGLRPSDVQTILNGVDLEEFHPGVEDRGSLNLPAGVPLALFVGDIRTSRKNLDSVLHAVQRLPDLHLVVVGELKNSPYPAMARSLNVANRVSFVGYRRDVPRLMRACDLFVFPSRYEACSLSLLEALAAGLPVVTSITAGGSEIITAECGRVMNDPNDISALVAAINSILAEIKTSRRLQHGARAVAEMHGWARMANEYLQLCENPLQGGGPRNSIP